MMECEKRPTQLLTASDELRKLIIDNPGLPLLVFAGDDAKNGDYYYMSCSNCRASKGEFLDCMQKVNAEYCYTDRDQFEEDLSFHLCDEFEGSDEEWEEFITEKMAEYEPYWKDCIILYVDN